MDIKVSHPIIPTARSTAKVLMTCPAGKYSTDILQKTIKLKVGGLSWYWRGDTIEPCLVFATPCTMKEYAARCRKHGVDPDGPNALKYDYSEDCYGVDNYGHDHNHPFTWQLFPFTGKITKRNMERLMETQKWYDDGCPA